MDNIRNLTSTSENLLAIVEQSSDAAIISLADNLWLSRNSAISPINKVNLIKRLSVGIDMYQCFHL